MKNFSFVLLSCLILVSTAHCSLFRTMYQRNIATKWQRDYTLDKLENAHFFTDYLHANDIESVRSRGSVNLESELMMNNENSANKFDSYAGYFNVDQKCNSNLYTWFFKNKNESAPVLLWLQGGPGGSSMFGLFTEVGPYFVDEKLKLGLRDYAWTNDYSVLFVDNPVGTGFSYTDKDECYARNQKMVSKDLFTLLRKFFLTFPELKNNEFYITGESYAGKYIPYLAYTIHQNKDWARQYFNFVGVAIGDGFTDPINQMEYSDLLYQVGLLDANQMMKMKKMQEKAADSIRQEKWLEAFDNLNLLIDGDLGSKSMFTNFTGMTYYFNFLNTVEPKDQSYFQTYLMQDKIRNLIHVGNHTFNNGEKVESFMREDMAKSVANEFVEVINNYKVLLYNGQLDVIVAPVCTENFLSKLDQWENLQRYLNAPKQIWKVNRNDSEVAGYVKSLYFNNQKQFHYVTVRNAGHILPHDKPKEAQDLLNRFITNRLHKND